MRKVLAIAPFVLILVLVLIFYLSGAYHLFNFQFFQEEYLKWKAYVVLHPALSAFYFIGIYIVSVVLIIPDSTILSILGGFLFPLPLAVTYACVAETIGATLFFLAARLAFSETLNKSAQRKLTKIQEKFEEEQACYLLFFRFSHLLPFWIVNLGASLLRVRPWTFVWTTFIGVLPLTIFLAEGGASLAKYFQTHTHFILKEIFTTELKVMLLVLGCLALVPIIYKKIRSRSQKPGYLHLTSLAHKKFKEFFSKDK